MPKPKHPYNVEVNCTDNDGREATWTERASSLAHRAAGTSHRKPTEIKTRAETIRSAATEFLSDPRVGMGSSLEYYCRTALTDNGFEGGALTPPEILALDDLVAR